VADAAVGQAKQVSRWCKQDLVPFKDGTFFKVLGDDIILSDPIVADQYTHIMGRLGVEVSPTKTFSGHVAEFAGFMVVPSHDGYTAFRPYKHPTGEWITNPLDFVHAMGSNVTTISNRWDEIFRAYSSTIGQRTLDLAPMLKDDSEEPFQISGKEPWLESLQVRLQSDILNLKDSSRTVLCVQEYLREQSGYNFCNQAFSDYVKSVVDPIYSAPRKNDVAFTPETAIKQSKKDKQDVKSELIRRFWSDPLNAKWRYEIEHSISTIGLPLRESMELATVRSKFQSLTSERRTVPPEISLDRSR
jgi:hypothetical protein